jgi:DNA helicase HerA-like ATPase
MSDPPTGELAGYAWWRLTGVPRVGEVADPRRWLASGVTAAVVASHATLSGSSEPAGRAVGMAMAWVRTAGSPRVQVLLGGRPVFPPVVGTGTGEGDWREGAARPVLFPPGAFVEPTRPGAVDEAFARQPRWVRCLGTVPVEQPDSPAGPGGWPPGPPSPGRPADGVTSVGLDDYALHLQSSFVWLSVVEPVGPEAIDAEVEQLTARLTMVRKRESSESSRVDLERGQRRVRELTRARASGLWRVHVLAGGQDERQARQAAALLCGAVDSAGSGHLLFPGSEATSLTEALACTVEGPDRAASPFLAGVDLVAVLMRPPVRELPGIRLLTPYRFDVTPVAAAALPATESTPGLDDAPGPVGDGGEVDGGEPTAGPGVEVGQVVDESLRPVGRFVVPYATVNRHGFISGATGSGKSQTTRRILESLSTGPRPVPWLVIEPAKAEYAGMAGRLGQAGEVVVIRPGELDAPPASLNPLEPEPGFPLQSHADLVRALFLAAFEANEPFPQVLSHSLTECYTAAGWNLVSGRLARPVKPRYRVDEPEVPAVGRYPTLRELQATARQVVDNIGYGREVAADVRGFVDVRMGSLRQGAPGRFFEGGHPLDVAGLVERNVVVELESITNDQDKAFLIGTVLIRLVEHLRVNGPVPELRHVLVIEEAHRLLRNVQDGPAAAAVELLASLLAEIRAYGEGVVIVEQIPSKILPDVIKNTAFKVMHRLPARDDRDVVGATMNLTDQNSESVVSLPPGVAAVSVDGEDRPLLIGVDDGTQREWSATAVHEPPLRGRRSALCGADCHTSACTLTQLDDASRVADHPAVVVWTEAVTGALILGRRPPRPRRAVLDQWTTDPRRRDCALATLAERAVDARRTRLAPWVAPDDFAAHLATVLSTLLTGEDPPAGEPGRWRAGAYRWQDTYTTLRAAVRAAPNPAASPPHPDTAHWRTIGLDLDAATLAGQFERLKNDPAYAHGNERVLFGDTATSGLDTALVQLAGSATANGLRRSLIHACVLGDHDPLFRSLTKRFKALTEPGPDGSSTRHV